VDRQRRAQALTAPGRVLASLSVAFVALSLSGCRNRKEEARQKAELTQALDHYRTQIGELQKQASALRARFDKLPEDLPDMGPVRDYLHALEEGLGVEDGRTMWLSGEIDKAIASGKKEEIEAVRKAMPHGTDGMTQMLVKVSHQMMGLEQIAGQRRFFERVDAENAAREQDAQKKRPPKPARE